MGAIALIVAGIGAFLVPFLLRGPALQASSNSGGNTNNNNNNGGTTPTSSTCTTNCSTNTTPPTCSSDQTTNSDSSHTNQGKHLAKGLDKQDKDTSLVGKAHGFMAVMAKHNPQHDATHSTKVDNDTVNTHGHDSNGHDTDDANACADGKDNEGSDDQGNDD